MRATRTDHHVLASVGSVGDCYDNALGESFVDSDKTELIADRVWRTNAQLELATVSYVGWFNHRRLHTSIGMRPPVEHERDYRARLALGFEPGPAETAPTVTDLRNVLTPVSPMSGSEEAPCPIYLTAQLPTTLRRPRQVQTAQTQHRRTIQLPPHQELRSSAAIEGRAVTRRRRKGGDEAHRHYAFSTLLACLVLPLAHDSERRGSDESLSVGMQITSVFNSEHVDGESGRSCRCRPT